MDLIQRIKSHEVISKYVSNVCADEGLCVSFDKDISIDEYVILDLDKFYKDLKLCDTPASPDCLIILKCQNGGHNLIAVEFKNIDVSERIKRQLPNIESKFDNCLNDFIKTRFKDLLFIEYGSIKLYFVSRVSTFKRDISLTMETLMSIRISFNGKKYMLNPYLPTPTIKKCY